MMMAVGKNWSVVH